MSNIRLSLEFAGAILPIGEDEQGRQVVPLKPISDVFGLDWKSQKLRIWGGDIPPPDGRNKRAEKAGMARRLGICTRRLPHAGQEREMTCIRLDRVEAFLNTINPEKVRAGGNKDGADFLERKQEEWDDLIHAYEVRNGMFVQTRNQQAMIRSRQLRDLVLLNREKRATEDSGDRRVFGALMREAAKELKQPMQEDLFDEAGTKNG